MQSIIADLFALSAVSTAKRVITETSAVANAGGCPFSKDAKIEATMERVVREDYDSTPMARIGIPFSSFKEAVGLVLVEATLGALEQAILGPRY